MKPRIALLMLGLMCGGAKVMADEFFVTPKDCAKATTGWGVVGGGVSCDGQELAIGKVRFLKGIGLHAPGELVIAAGGRWRWLTFSAGINAAMTERGSVVVEVFGDDKPVFKTPVLRVREGPRYCEVPVAGTRVRSCLSVFLITLTVPAP